VQFRKPGSFAPLADLVGGGPFDLPRGAWTDDTAMALCLAESLLESGGADPADQVRRYQAWQQDGHLSSTGQCVGITASVARALATARWSGKSLAGSHDPARLDKEPLARVGAAVLYYFPDAAQAVQQSAEVVRTTHQSPVVLDACRYFGALLYGALKGTSKTQLLQDLYAPLPALWERRPLKVQIEQVASGSFRRKAPPEVEGGGSVVQCLEAALWALNRSRNFRDGALLAVNLGLDADVTGAVYGQLAGAVYGVGGIPASWRRALLRRELIEEFADKLLSNALTRMAEAPG
jgi:ADP-ribosylglycohydrolase